MAGQARAPIDIKELFAVGRRFLVYVPDGPYNELGQWEAEVLGLDLEDKQVKLRLVANWKGLDTREGVFFSKDFLLGFSQILIPVLDPEAYPPLPPKVFNT